MRFAPLIMESLKIVENFPLTSLIMLRSLTNGNSKRILNAVKETNVPFLPLELTAT